MLATIAPSTLEAALDKLAQTRAALDEADTQWKAAQADFYAEFGPLDQQRKTLKDTADKQYADVAAAAVSEYEATGNKRPDADAEIKLVDDISYDEEKVFTWALKTGRGDLLKLDARAFEKAAKEGNVDMRYVRITPSPKAYIASKLAHRLSR